MAKKNYYAWIYTDGAYGFSKTWPECQAAVNHQSGVKYQGFATFAEAWQFVFPGREMPDENSALQGINTQKERTIQEEKTICMHSALVEEVSTLNYDKNEVPFVPTRFYKIRG